MLLLNIKILGSSSRGKKWKITLLIIAAVFSAAALSGIVLKSFVPFGPMLFALLFISAITFSFSDSGKQLSEVLAFSALIGLQGFRLPLELILHHWSSIGTVPETMTWTGQNWDILAGAISILAIPFLNKSWKAALIVNTFGFLLLLNVVRVVVLSSPLPFSWQLENPLLLVAFFPYCLIGPLFVMPALIGHLIVYRKIYLITSKRDLREKNGGGIFSPITL
jgi:hypothetical protein